MIGRFLRHEVTDKLRAKRSLSGLLALLVFGGSGIAGAAPHVPQDDSQVLIRLPAGSRYANEAVRTLERNRLDVALPLARIHIERARATADMRYLGYAEATLASWMRMPVVPSAVLVLHATILQSRHQFDAALIELDRALSQSPDNAQAWLTRATVLRVMGRYDEALQSCRKLPAGPTLAASALLCEQALRGLTGNLRPAYALIVSMNADAQSVSLKAWRYSELAEMAQRLGDDAAAERWLIAGLHVAPEDFYMRAAYADLLLRQNRDQTVLDLLAGREAIEPLLLRSAIAQRRIAPEAGKRAAAQLADSFAIEQRREEEVHRRELARYYLDVDLQPQAALRAATLNWQVQKEPEDLLILQRAAAAAGNASAARPAREFVRQHGLEDARL